MIKEISAGFSHLSMWVSRPIMFKHMARRRGVGWRGGGYGWIGGWEEALGGGVEVEWGSRIG